MGRLDGLSLLQLWDDGEPLHPLDRALRLFSVAAPTADAPADVSLGTCHSTLMSLHAECFGSQLPAWMDCPCCGERMAFELDVAQLPPPITPPATLEVQGLQVRCPTPRDLAAIARADTVEQAAEQLFQRCVLNTEALPDTPEARQLLHQAVEHAIEAADPWSDLALAVQCPACGQATDACLDTAAYLWERVAARAQGLLDDVHVLAQAYGWSEPQVLALSDARRAAYLARVQP